MEDEADAGGEAVDLAAILDRYHQLALETQNSVYVWLAIQAIFQARGVMAAEVTQPVTFPTWVSEYLRQVADTLMILSAGLDPRVEVVPLPLEIMSKGFEEAVQSQEFQDSVAAQSITPKQAIALVPNALGLVWGTVNGFEALSRTSAKMQDFRLYQAMTAAGTASKVAVAAIGKSSGVSNARQVYARIKEGQELAEPKEVRKLDP